MESRNGQQLTQSREKDSVGPRGGQLLRFFGGRDARGQLSGCLWKNWVNNQKKGNATDHLEH